MKKRKAFTLIELLVVVAIIALLISILLPSLSRARELSKRLVCASNVKGMGTAFKIYANDYDEAWPVPAFKESTSTYIKWNREQVAIGYEPYAEGSAEKPGRLSPSYTGDEAASGGTGTETLSVTRAMWMMVRSGDVTAKSFICPSSGNQIDSDQNVDLYYDFKSSGNISYGYQVPYGPFDSRPSEAVDPRMAVGGDRGPYYSGGSKPSSNTNWNSTSGVDALSPQEWKPYNSPNHGGTGSGEGQNVLFGDGHATFEKTPLAGIDNDNIYTLMSDEEGNGADFVKEGAGSGYIPNSTNITQEHYYPGHNALQPAGASNRMSSTTDSLIYP